MNFKKIVYSLTGVVAIASLVALSFTLKPGIQKNDTILKNDPLAATDIKNVTIKIVTSNITFKNGVSEITDEGADTNTVIRFFGEPVFNGQNEAYFYVTQNSEGSGTFFYAAGAHKVNGKWLGTNAIFLGDRIAPQNINIINNVANFNFADRIKGQPFSSPPRSGVTKRFSISDGILKEVK